MAARGAAGESRSSYEGEAAAAAALPGRRLALIVHTWGHMSSFYAWTFMKQYLLKRVETDDCTALDPTEQLFIVKAGKGDEGDERWKMGGPLVPDLDTAVAHYPCTVVRLEGGVKSSSQSWLKQNNIDIMVVGEHWPSAGLQLTASVSEWVKQHVSCPFIIIRRGAVANARMKISSSQAGGSGTNLAQQATAVPPPAEAYLTRTSPACPRTAAMTGRRIALAYSSFAMGRALIQFAKDKVLTQRDTIYICHVFPEKNNPMVNQTMKLMRAMSIVPPRSEGLDEVTRDNSIDFGAAELAGYRVHLNVVLQGDAKSALTSFCESEEIELLIIGTRSGGRIRKKLSGGSVSSHLIDHAPCPCLVVPYRHLGIDEGRDTADEEALGTSPGSPPSFLAAAAGEPGAGPLDVQRSASPAFMGGEAPGEGGGVGGAHSTPSDLLARIQNQLEEKDRIIAELRQQVHDLQLAAAQREAAERHDPAKGSLAM